MLYLVAGLLAIGLGRPALVLAGGGEVAWVEDFADDPLAAGRFVVPDGHDPTRFTYDAVQHFVTVHYDTILPTAWYMRPLDPAGGRVLGRYEDFAFSVTFRVREAGFFADPNQFAQIAWGLVNSATTGGDRAGGSAGPYAFDCASFDYFPNVSPLYGGPTIGPTIIHRNDAAGYFANIEFSFGSETQIETAFGDETILCDGAQVPCELVYVARFLYQAADQVATVTIEQGGDLLAINTDGAGGYGGFDGDPSTIQLFLTIDKPFVVDSFALLAWQDTMNPFASSVIADVDVLRVEFFAPAIVLGDMNVDGNVDGEDIGVFVQAFLLPGPDPSLVARGDFNANKELDFDDVDQFIAVLLNS